MTAFLLFSTFDVLESIVDFSQRHEEYELDELLSTLIVFVFCMLVFSWRRIKESDTNLLNAKHKSAELQRALAKVKTLQGVLPTCSYCNKVRDDQGAWNELQSYIVTIQNPTQSARHAGCGCCRREVK